MGSDPGDRKPSPTAGQDQPKLNPGDAGPPGTPGIGENVCRVCNGSGKVGGAECPTCGGTGKVLVEIGGA